MATSISIAATDTSKAATVTGDFGLYESVGYTISKTPTTFATGTYTLALKFGPTTIAEDDDPTNTVGVLTGTLDMDTTAAAAAFARARHSATLPMTLVLWDDTANAFAFAQSVDVYNQPFDPDA